MRLTIERMRTLVLGIGAILIVALISFLVTDCCDGHPELCNLEDALRTSPNVCCAPAPKANARRKK